MTNEKPKPPEHLSKQAKALWTRLCAEYVIDDAAAELLLESALLEFDKCENARKILAKEGDFIFDRFHQRKSHPALAVVRDSRATMLKCFRALNLDLEPLLAVGRPPGTSRPIGK